MEAHQQVKSQKEFQCPVCLKFFSRKFTLEMHFLIHQGVKPHACPFCGKCFRQKGTLMRHKALHSSTALFHCNLCNRSFRQKNVFLHHLKHRHKVSTENLDRRKWRTQITDNENLITTLPSFSSAETVAITTSDKNLENIFFNTCASSSVHSQNKNKNTSTVFSPDRVSIQQQNINTQLNVQNNSVRLSVQNMSDRSISNSTNASNCFNRNIPQPGSRWQCNICNFEIPFDYLTCNSHISIHEQKLKHKCCLCLKLFATNTDYHQHMVLYHGNSKLITEEMPSCSKFSVSQNNINVTNSQLLALPSPNELNNSVLMPFENRTEAFRDSSVYLKSVDVTIQPCPSDSHIIQDINNTHTNKTDMTFTCIPCHLDFSVEEDFECHVKTHVQSVLLSDSESLEIEDVNNIENVKTSLPSDKPLFHNSNEMTTNSVMTSSIGNNTRNFAGYLPQQFTTNTQTEVDKIQNRLDGIGCNQNSNENSQNCKRICKKSQELEINQYLNNNTLIHTSDPRRFEYHTTSNFHGNRSMMKRHISNTPKHNMITSSSYNSTPLSNFRKRTIATIRQNNGNKQLVYLNSSCKKDNTSTQKCASRKLLNRRRDVIYLCPFCKKYFSSADRLCRHATLHVHAVQSRFHKKFSSHANTTNVKSVIDKRDENKKIKKNSILTDRSSVYHSTSNDKKCSEFWKLNKNGNIFQVDESNHIFSSSSKYCKYYDTNYTQTGNKHRTVEAFSMRSPKNVYSSHSSHSSYFKCKRCKKIFSKKSIYHYHMQLHLGVHTFRCLMCHRRFLCKEQLLRHSRAKHLKSYQCSICLRIFHYGVVYRYHIRSCNKKHLNNNLLCPAGNISVPIIDLREISKLKLENLIGVIPISDSKKINDTPGMEIIAAIPVISPTGIDQLNNLPLIGKFPLLG